MSADAIFIGCDNLVEWDGAQNEADDSYLNAAVASFTLKTLAGVAVTGAEGDTGPSGSR